MKDWPEAPELVSGQLGAYCPVLSEPSSCASLLLGCPQKDLWLCGQQTRQVRKHAWVSQGGCHSDVLLLSRLLPASPTVPTFPLLSYGHWAPTVEKKIESAPTFAEQSWADPSHHLSGRS